MHCKLIKHGLAISYDHVIKPCCLWSYDKTWGEQHTIKNTDLGTWHSSHSIVEIQKQFDNSTWPTNCSACANLEQEKRNNSVRGYANRAYKDYDNDDITLEIRPGSVCNFACQTCWPEASSKVAYFYRQAGLANELASYSIDDFAFLNPVASRIRNVVLLGGEPFYDKNCLKFLAWAAEHLQAPITMYTNGSVIDWELVSRFKFPITLSFSIDATGRPAEYVRFGTVWDEVYANYKRAHNTPNVNVRANITSSAYNLHYIESVIDLFLEQWPEVVTFGAAVAEHLRDSVIPIEHRKEIVSSLSGAAIKIMKSQIDNDQKHNAVNSLKGIIHNLNTEPHNATGQAKLVEFIATMDRVKQVDIRDYCELTAKILSL